MKILERIINKIIKEKIKYSRMDTPYHPQTTYVDKNNQWYDPVIVDADNFVEPCSGFQSLVDVSNILDKLSEDDYLRFFKGFYKAGINNINENWKYADILTVLYGICSNVSINSYLEIGVRRARSMAIVASVNPNVEIIGFDLWIQNYAGMENPGPEFVRNELKNIGHEGNVDLIDGDSKRTIPKYFKDNPTKYFDLITVDGDHSKKGAIADLKNVIPRIKIGGFLIFDDINNPNHRILDKVWRKYIINSKRFLSHEFKGAGLGVGFAIKLY